LCVLWKNLQINTWQGPDTLLTTCWRYACVFPEHEWRPRWLPLWCIKPVTAIDMIYEKTLSGQMTVISLSTGKEGPTPSSDLGVP
jgi:hypothetical protein